MLVRSLTVVQGYRAVVVDPWQRSGQSTKGRGLDGLRVIAEPFDDEFPKRHPSLWRSVDLGS